MHFRFNSKDPDASALDVSHGDIGLHAEKLMNHEAYTNPFHRLHHRAVSDVNAAFATLYGDKLLDGAQPYSTITIATGADIGLDEVSS
jgi:hypothetical protein